MFLGFFSLVCVFPFCFVLRLHTFTRRPSQWLDLRQARGARRPPLARVRARGSPSAGGGLVPSCFGIWLPYFVGRGSQGPRAFCLGWGRFLCPHTGPFSHARFLSPPQVFFFFFFFWAFGACALRGEQDAILEHAWNDEFRELPRIPRRTP